MEVRKAQWTSGSPFHPQGSGLETLFVLYRRASQFFPAPEVAWARKKGEKRGEKGEKSLFLASYPQNGARSWSWDLFLVVWIQELIELPRWEETISPASFYFFITQIQNKPDSWALFTLNCSSCLLPMERTQLRDGGSPEPLEKAFASHCDGIVSPTQAGGDWMLSGSHSSRTQLLPILLPQYLQAEALGRFSQAHWASFSCSPHPVAMTSTAVVA